MASQARKKRKKPDILIGSSRRAAIALGYSPRIRLYTTREVAIMLRHAVPWVLKQINSGKMKAVRHGYQYFVPHIEVARWMGYSKSSSPFRKLNPPRRKGDGHADKPTQVAKDPPEVKLPAVQRPSHSRILGPPNARRESAVWLLLQDVSAWPRRERRGEER